MREKNILQKLQFFCPEGPVPVAAPQAEEKGENREKVKSEHFDATVLRNSGGSPCFALNLLFLVSRSSMERH